MAVKLSPEEKAAHRAAFQKMTPAQKLDHIITYYKLPIILAIAALAVLISTAVHVARKKEAVLYLGLANLSVSESTKELLTTSFLTATGRDPRRSEVYLYEALYLSDDPDAQDHEYAYASQLKLMASVNAGRMDLLLMNREAYDLLSEKGYLADLSELPAAQADSVLAEAAPYLTRGEVVLSDNALEVSLGEAAEHVRTTKEAVNGVLVSDVPALRGIGFSGDVYLGIAGNTSRLKECLSYLHYILQDPQETSP